MSREVDMVAAMKGKWQVQGSRDVYENEWTTVSILDVQLPDGSVTEHHAISQPVTRGTGANVIAHNEEGQVLMIWRHRVVTDSWAWELPGGGVESSELPNKAAGREFKEETGWDVGKLSLLTTFTPLNGLIDYTLHSFITTNASWTNGSPDENEVTDIAWLSIDEIVKLMHKGDISDACTLLPLLWAMQFGPLKQQKTD